MNTIQFLILFVVALFVTFLIIQARARKHPPSHRSQQRAGFRPLNAWESFFAPIVWAMRWFTSWTHRVQHPNRIALANDNLAVTRHCESGTYLTDAALVLNRIVKLGTDDKHVNYCGAADVPFGWIEDSPASGDPVGVQILGLTRKSLVCSSSEAIAIATRIFPAANGQVQDLPAVSGTYYCIGISATAADGADDKLEVIPGVPYPVVVP